MPTLIDILNSNAGRFCTKPIVRYRNYQLDYARVLDRSDRLAQALRNLKYEQGDLIILFIPNIPEFVTAYFGCLKAGCRVIPMNLSFRKHEIKYIFNNPEVKGVIYWDRFEKKIVSVFEQLQNIPKLICVGKNIELESQSFEKIIESSQAISTDEYPEEGEEAVVLFSSGTSGNPKGVVLSHENILKSAESIVKNFEFTSTDKIIGALPLYNFLGHSVIMNAGLLCGAEIILHTRFKPNEIVQSIQRSGATVMVGTPTMYMQLAEYNDDQKIDTPGVRFGIVSGDFLYQDTALKIKEKYGFPLIQSYGCVETTSIISGSLLNGKTDVNNLGKFFDCVEAKLLDEKGNQIHFTEDYGELVISSPMNMKRYFNNSSEEQENVSKEWVSPGDMCSRDDSGSLHFVCHNSEIIHKGNFPIIAGDIEAVISEHDSVHEVAVVGIPNKDYFQEVKAFILKKHGNNTSEKEIIDFCASKLPKYKVPKEVAFLDNFPRTISGKILKRFLK
ncbi:class I adenylate-forming enzyme family protein [candidate division KSB1 bacterium]